MAEVFRCPLRIVIGAHANILLAKYDGVIGAWTNVMLGIEAVCPERKEEVWDILGSATVDAGLGALNRESFENIWGEFLKRVNPNFVEQECEVCRISSRFYLQWGRIRTLPPNPPSLWIVFSYHAENHLSARMREGEMQTVFTVDSETVALKRQMKLFVGLKRAITYVGLGELDYNDFRWMWKEFLRMNEPAFTERECVVRKIGDQFSLTWGS